jgi:hypothetical protein
MLVSIQTVRFKLSRVRVLLYAMRAWMSLSAKE